MKLSALRGKILLVDFWGMWCGPCVAQLPKLREIHERFRGTAFEVIGIDSDKDPGLLRQFLATNHVDWTNVLDHATDGPLATAWRVGEWPSTFLIDETGVIRARNLAPDTLEAKIAGMLKKK